MDLSLALLLDHGLALLLRHLPRLQRLNNSFPLRRLQPSRLIFRQFKERPPIKLQDSEAISFSIRLPDTPHLPQDLTTCKKEDRLVKVGDVDRFLPGQVDLQAVQ